MLTLEQITAQLQDRKPAVVAEATGLHPATVWRVQTGRHMRLSHDTVRRLSDYLIGKGAAPVATIDVAEVVNG